MGRSIQEWTSKICGRQPLKTLKRYGLLDMVCLRRPYPFKLFKGCPPQILLGPLLNTSSQIIHQLKTVERDTVHHQQSFEYLQWYISKKTSFPTRITTSRITT